MRAILFKWMAISMAYASCLAHRVVGTCEPTDDAGLLQLHLAMGDNYVDLIQPARKGKAEAQVQRRIWSTRLVDTRQSAQSQRSVFAKNFASQHWHTCDPERDAHVSDGMIVFPDEWLLAKSRVDCRSGKRGRLRIMGGDPGAGFATEFFLYMINHILLAEMHCLSPVINLTCAGAPLWFDPSSLQNPWEWFFEPLEVAPGTPLTEYRITNEQRFFMHLSAPWALHSMYYGTNIDIQDFDEPWYRRMRRLGHRVVRRYFVVKHSVEREVQSLWDLHFSGTPRVLGMHYRGGDKTGRYRTGFDNVSAYRDYAVAFLEAYPTGKIMFATDDSSVEMEIRNGTWPAAVKKALTVPQSSSYSGDKQFDVYMTESRVSSEMRGRAVLSDILMLAKSDFFIYGQSTVAESVFYLNSGMHNSSIPIWFKGRPRPSKEWFLSNARPETSWDSIVNRP